jgi:hypothetical protein
MALYTTSLLRWLQRKRYQYEVTFSLYMLTPTEKFIFSKFTQPQCDPLSLYSAHPSANLFRRLGPFPLPFHGHYRGLTLPSRTHINHHATRLVLLGWRRDCNSSTDYHGFGNARVSENDDKLV